MENQPWSLCWRWLETALARGRGSLQLLNSGPGLWQPALLLAQAAGSSFLSTKRLLRFLSCFLQLTPVCARPLLCGLCPKPHLNQI